MPKFLPPRIDLEKALKMLSRVRIVEEKMKLAEIKEMLSRFKRKGTFDHWIDCEGKIAFLLYLGKVPGILRSESGLPDLSNLLILKELDDFAEGKREEGKELSFSIIFENYYFDRHIFEMDVNKRKVKKTIEFAKKLKLRNIEFSEYEEMTNEIVPEYFEEFEKAKKEIKIKKRGQVAESLWFNYYSYPFFKDFKEALRAYLGEEEFLKEWAEKVTRNYLAFLRAREKVEWWQKFQGAGFIRATISKKPGVISINPYIGRLSFAHGVATLLNCELSTEFFIDVLQKQVIVKKMWKGIPILYC